MVVGKTLGHYRILEKLGSGGTGRAYLAEDITRGRRVALKILPVATTSSVEHRQRFEREARALVALSHPNVLSLLDFGEDGGVAFAVMELLEGRTLRQLLDEGSLSPVEAMEYARQMADGLGTSHARGLVHRKLRPENVFIAKGGKVRILDFGLAEEKADEPTSYLAPEQVRGQAADSRSDVFSFGAVLYEMLSGDAAFGGGSPAATESSILNDHPPQLLNKNRNLPPRLSEIVDRCLKKNPEERFQSAQDIGESIEALSEERTTDRPPIVDEEPTRKRHKWKFFLAFLVIFGPAVLAIAFLHLTSDLRAQRQRAQPQLDEPDGTGRFQSDGEKGDPELPTGRPHR